MERKIIVGRNTHDDIKVVKSVMPAQRRVVTRLS